MATTKTFTFTECCSILDVSPKTFRKWLALAGINTMEQVSSADNRVKRLTFEQLSALAQHHERPLELPDEQVQAEPQPRDATAIIQDTLEIFEQRLQQLERDRDTLSRQVTALQQTIEHLAQSSPQLQPLQSSVKTRTTKARKTPQPEYALPTDLVSLRAFAELHAVNGNEAFDRWRNGATRITPAEKMTRRGKTSDIFINSEGKHDFWVSFHKEPSFRSCDHCPHV